MGSLAARRIERLARNVHKLNTVRALDPKKRQVLSQNFKEYARSLEQRSRLWREAENISRRLDRVKEEEEEITQRLADLGYL